MNIPMEKFIPIDARDMKSVIDELRNKASASRREADLLQRKVNEALAAATAYETSADTLKSRVERLSKIALEISNEQQPTT